MIGVAVSDEERYGVEETFQLLKIPHKGYRRGEQYDVVIATQRTIDMGDSRTLLVTTNQSHDLDRAFGISIQEREPVVHWATNLDNQSIRMPIYGPLSTIHGPGKILAQINGGPVALEVNRNGTKYIRLGYNIFGEIAYVLNERQPLPCCRVPTVDLQLGVVRRLLQPHCPLFVELPPVPFGRAYSVALTHDVDEAPLKELTLSSALLGFFYRGLILSTVELFTRKKTWGDWMTSWRYVLSYPLIKLSLLRDPWEGYADCTNLEDEFGVRSSFYFLPSKGIRGMGLRSCKAPRARICQYEVSAKKDTLDALAQGGWEIGVHGIDSWVDEVRAREEREKIASLIPTPKIGIRIHWLYFRPDSWKILDKAGYEYDTTIGYSDDIGFAAGTLQVYKPANVKNLLELPLHIQDKTLLGERGLHLGPQAAFNASQELFQFARHFGGVVTLLWHSTSMAAPRLWGKVYGMLVRRALSDGAWVAKAADIVAWFRRRRAVTFGTIEVDGRNIVIEVSGVGSSSAGPSLCLRVYIDPGSVAEINSDYRIREGCVDIELTKSEIYILLKQVPSAPTG